MRAGMWYSVVGAMLLGLLAFATVSQRAVAQTSCEYFDAANITGLTDEEAISITPVKEYPFFCVDQEFFQGPGETGSPVERGFAKSAIVVHNAAIIEPESRAHCIDPKQALSPEHNAFLACAETMYSGTVGNGRIFTGVSAAITVSGIIAAISFICTNGEESAWLGRDIEDDTLFHSRSFDIGITSINTQEMVSTGGYVYRGALQVNGFDLTPENELNATSWEPPLGTLENATLDETVTSTDCRGTGLEAFATGVTIWASTYDIRGIQFVCAEVTPTCLPRRYPNVLTPAPSAAPPLASPEEATSVPTAGAQSETDDESRWFDAAWEVAVTVMGALTTGGLALLLRTCYHGGLSNHFERCKRREPEEMLSPGIRRRDIPPVAQVPAKYAPQSFNCND